MKKTYLLFLASASIQCLYAAKPVAEKKYTQIEDIASDLCEAVVNVVESDSNQRIGNSLGSGFIISEDGYIVTNNHVLGEENVSRVMVVLHDGTRSLARVVGRDARVDIALLKISPGKRVKFLRLGDSDKVKLCQRVIAIGSPFGFENTVTSGIISKKSRNISNSMKQIGGGDLVDYIQTDASINNGSSGGPLIIASGNNIGDVIAMNTTMFSDTDVSSGINFAIPSNLIKYVVKQLKQFGKIKRAWVGVSFVPLQSDVLSALKIGGYKNAVMVTKVEPDSPAYRAGIRLNDVILSINSINLSGNNIAGLIVSALEIGSNVGVLILREEKKKLCKIKVGYKEHDEQPGHGLANSLRQLSGIFIKELGMTVANISQDMMTQLGLSINSQQAVVVSDVNNMIAQQHDINIGDLILSINLRSVNDAAAMQKYISDIKTPDTRIALYISRRGESFFRVLNIRNAK